MRRLVLPLSLALLATSAGTVPAKATVTTAAPTVNGRYQVPYYGTVIVSGTSPAPRQSVVIEFKSQYDRAYRPLRHLVSDATGRFATSYVATATESYYAVAGGAASPVRTTHLLSATCTVSGPAFTSMAAGRDPAAPAYEPSYNAFSATRDGMWAGVSEDVARAHYAVVLWQPGHERIALQRGTLPTISDPRGGVRVAGLGPGGRVVVSFEPTDAGPGTYDGYVWVARVRHALAREPGWISVRPTGVNDGGGIVGEVRSGTARSWRYLIVRWDANGASPTVLGTFPADEAPWPVVDGAGDITYVDGLDAVVLRRNGVRQVLPASGPVNSYPPIPLVGGAGHTVFGDDNRATVRWDIGDGSVPIRATAVAGRLGNDTPAAAGGVDGQPTLLEGYMTYYRRYVITPRGAKAVLPPEVRVANVFSGGNAIDRYGRIAFTSHADNLVHFLTCR